MFTTTTYKGIDKNGIYGIYCGFKPKGLKVQEEVTVYHPDEGKVFVKGEEEYSAVILQPGEVIEDYEEIAASDEKLNSNEEEEINDDK